MQIFSVLLYTLSEKNTVFNYAQSLCFNIILITILGGTPWTEFLHTLIKPEQEGMQLLDFLRSKDFSQGILSSMKADKKCDSAKW